RRRAPHTRKRETVAAGRGGGTPALCVASSPPASPSAPPCPSSLCPPSSPCEAETGEAGDRTYRPLGGPDRVATDRAFGAACGSAASWWRNCASRRSSECALAETCAVEAGFDAAPSCTLRPRAKNPATTAAPSMTTIENRCLRAISYLLVVLMSASTVGGAAQAPGQAKVRHGEARVSLRRTARRERPRVRRSARADPDRRGRRRDREAARSRARARGCRRA